MANPLRVLVVEDSVTVRQRLVEVLATDPEVVVVGEAGDGRQAVELCLKLQPDVITMDMMMPTMTGLAATEQIMAHRPTPILIVSSSTNRGELFRMYQALAAGAVDVLEKPLGDDSDSAWEARFLSTLKLVARIRVITHLRGRLGTPSRAPAALPFGAPPTSRPFTLAAVGASTGGPAAIVEVLRALPADFALPVLLVLHIGAPFGTSFADWLDGQVGLQVRFAIDGQRLDGPPGRVLMAPPERHLTLQGGRLRLTAGPERHSCRPSIDVLYDSIALETGASTVACLLTGMGRDGAAGLLAIRQAGGLTIAQDEATSVVYGMPREAVLLGAAERVLPIGQIGPCLAGLTDPRSSSSRSRPT
ncbi:MAG TPA: chemotaxis-specific protein-glutamate methyltransferase CheB [Polyangia bacterium]|nr:chemotaxis-specific protein-glutamate methyltransferase CheB [Polyangia bacterium]